MTEKFSLGQIVVTRGISDLGLTHGQIARHLDRHVAGDWGKVDPESAHQNELALIKGDRLVSAYAIDESQPCVGYGDNCIWVITEADRSTTTLLLPSEY